MAHPVQEDAVEVVAEPCGDTVERDRQGHGLGDSIETGHGERGVLHERDGQLLGSHSAHGHGRPQGHAQLLGARQIDNGAFVAGVEKEREGSGRTPSSLAAACAASGNRGFCPLSSARSTPPPMTPTTGPV